MYLGDSSAHADLHRAALHTEADQHRLLREARAGRRRWWERLFLSALRPLANMHTDRRRARHAARNATLIILGALLANAATITASANSDTRPKYEAATARSANADGSADKSADANDAIAGVRLQSGYRVAQNPDPTAARYRARSVSGSAHPWTWVAVVAVVLAAGATALTMRRRSHRSGTRRTPAWSVPSTHPWDAAAAAAQYSTIATAREGELQ